MRHGAAGASGRFERFAPCAVVQDRCQQTLSNRPGPVRMICWRSEAQPTASPKRRIVKLLRRDHQPSERVAFTFTEKTARKLKDRVGRITQAEPGANQGLGGYTSGARTPGVYPDTCVQRRMFPEITRVFVFHASTALNIFYCRIDHESEQVSINFSFQQHTTPAVTARKYTLISC